MESNEVELAILRAEVKRIISDIESEKATRARANMELLRRIDESDDRTAEKLEEVRQDQRKSDRILYMILGGLAVIQFATAFLHK
jgi:vesicle coat complex subunit